jgi:hypothetical protein
MMERWKARAGAVAVAVTGFLLAPPQALAQGCAMCRTAVDGQDDPLSRGISHSVIFMIAMPFAVFFSGAGWLFLTHRRARRAAMRESEAQGGTLPMTAANELATRGV